MRIYRPSEMESINDLKRVLEDLFERPFPEEEVIKIGLILTDLAELLIDRKSKEEDLPRINNENYDHKTTTRV